MCRDMLCVHRHNHRLFFLFGMQCGQSFFIQPRRRYCTGTVIKRQDFLTAQVFVQYSVRFSVMDDVPIGSRYRRQ